MPASAPRSAACLDANTSSGSAGAPRAHRSLASTAAAAPTSTHEKHPQKSSRAGSARPGSRRRARSSSSVSGWCGRHFRRACDDLAVFQGMHRQHACTLQGGI